MSRFASTIAAKPARRAIAALVVVAIAAAWWGFLRPTFVADGPVQLVVVSGESMEPGMSTGDLAVLYRRDSYAAGDVVAYRSGRIDGVRGGRGPVVIHRITGGNGADGFVLRGDNTSADDPWRPTRADIVGERVFSAPAVGSVVNWLSQPVHAGALLAAVFVTMILASDPKRREPRSDDEAPAEREPVA